MAIAENTSNLQELKKRVIVTLALLAVYRLGCYLPVPGLDTAALTEWVNEATKNSDAGNKVFDMLNMFNGGALRNATVFALGIMPYISASIIFQLFTHMVPAMEKLSKEGEAGRKKIAQYTKYATIVICLVQAFFICLGLTKISIIDLVLIPDVWFVVLGTITLTAGTAFLLWLGEVITDKGIGNGISLIIMVGIISSMPLAFGKLASNFTLELSSANPQDVTLVKAISLITLFVVMVVSVVFVQQGQRRVPIQQAKRSSGSRVYGGVRSDLPLKILQANVIPIIFASAVMFVPQALGNIESLQFIFARFSDPSSHPYVLVYIGLIVFFCFFYTMIIFNPTEIADNLKKGGYFIPGYRPGKKTADYLDWIMLRLTFAGAIFLAVIAEVPLVIQGFFSVDFLIASLFGGTGLLIVVGVGLDLLDKIQSYLLVRNYEGIMQSTSKYKSSTLDN